MMVTSKTLCTMVKAEHTIKQDMLCSVVNLRMLFLSKVKYSIRMAISHKLVPLSTDNLKAKVLYISKDKPKNLYQAYLKEALSLKEKLRCATVATTKVA